MAAPFNRLAAVALTGVLAHRLRSALAAVGLVVGVAAVVLMVALGEGSRNKVMGQITALGTNLITVQAAKISLTGGRQRQTSQVSTLTSRDAVAIERLSAVAAAVPRVERSLTINHKGISLNSQIVASPREVFSLEEHSLVEGRYFTDREEKSARRLAVVGASLRQSLVGEESIVGRSIEIKKQPFVVIGELAPKGADAFGNDLDNRAYIPLKTAQRRLLGGQRFVDSVIVQAVDQKAVPALEGEMRLLLRSRHRLTGTSKPDDFRIRTQLEALQARQESGRLFTVLITSVAGISLLVAGVGIMAVMLISVRERTGEIGLRRALGARQKDVLVQFLLEALALGLGGGLTGAALGMAIAQVLRTWGGQRFDLPWELAWLAAGVSCLIALLFGLVPARRAARLNPVEALTST